MRYNLSDRRATFQVQMMFMTLKWMKKKATLCKTKSEVEGRDAEVAEEDHALNMRVSRLLKVPRHLETKRSTRPSSKQSFARIGLSQAASIVHTKTNVSLLTVMMTSSSNRNLLPRTISQESVSHFMADTSVLMDSAACSSMKRGPLKRWDPTTMCTSFLSLYMISWMARSNSHTLNQEDLKFSKTSLKNHKASLQTPFKFHLSITLTQLTRVTMTNSDYPPPLQVPSCQALSKRSLSLWEADHPPHLKTLTPRSAFTRNNWRKKSKKEGRRRRTLITRLTLLTYTTKNSISP